MTTVLLLFGGESSEHEVSIKGAKNVYASLDKNMYELLLGYIDKKGKWWLVDNIDDLMSDNNNRHLFTILPGEQKITIPDMKNERHIDVAFPILHGKNGEDGTVQGLLTIAHIPFVGPSLVGAAVTMDKEMTKEVLRSVGLPVTEWVTWRTSQKRPIYNDLKAVFENGMFVKPSSSGSSIGVSLVRTEEEFDKALSLAANHDSKVLIEAAIKGIEVQVGIYGVEQPKVSQICEIESTASFHDFEDKYSQTSSVKFHIPARLSEQQTNRILNNALEAYKMTECNGMARIDFFVVDENTEYINEINAIPGFTNVSVFPMVWKHSGMSYDQLVNTLITSVLYKD